ncbi:MAG: type III pantothenate kinase [Peptococcaceae bacterium]|nr:type III pantothenate kinase [Peptococcaceae bacterium]
MSTPDKAWAKEARAQDSRVTSLRSAYSRVPQPRTLLAFDVGNTNIVIGIFCEGSLIQRWRVSTEKNRSADEYAVLMAQLLDFVDMEFEYIQGAVISSVVPPATPALEVMLRDYIGVAPLVIGPGTKTGLPIQCYNPREVGADRIVNAVAGLAKYGAPLIIIDFGTATTFCALNEKGEYMGGAIAPGIAISSEALFQGASKLPRVDLANPGSVIGRDTVSSMQAGIYYGFCGQAEKIVSLMTGALIQQGLGDVEKIQVVATGGIAALMAESCSAIDMVDEDLTLEGLRILYEKNTLNAV